MFTYRDFRAETDIDDVKRMPANALLTLSRALEVEETLLEEAIECFREPTSDEASDESFSAKRPISGTSSSSLAELMTLFARSFSGVVESSKAEEILVTEGLSP